MWIERIRFYGFGAIAGEQIEFAQEDINLIIEPNQYGKSTMVESIWAILFDFPDDGEERANLTPWNDEAGYAAVLDISTGERALRIVRDFANKSVQVLDRDNEDADITEEFIGEDGQELIGQRITGMNRELFRASCLLGQRHLDDHHSRGKGAMVTELKGMADSAASGTTAGAAVGMIDECLSNYDGSKTLDSEIGALEARQKELSDKLEELEQSKEQIIQWLAEMAELDDIMDSGAGQPADAEFVSLRLEQMDLHQKLDTITSRQEKKTELEERLNSMQMNSPMTDNSLTNLNELWLRRQSRITDMDGLKEEVKPQQDEYERLQQELDEKYVGFDNLTKEEGNTVSTLAVNLYNLQRETIDLRKDLLESTGKHLAPLIDSRSEEKGVLALQSALSKEEIEEAKSYASLVVAFNEQQGESDKKVEEVRFNLSDIQEKQVEYRNKNFINSIMVFVTAILCVFNFSILEAISIEMPKMISVCILILGIVLFLVAVFMFIRFIRFKSYMAPELEAAKEESNRLQKAAQQGRLKVSNLDGKLMQIAQKAGLQSKEALLEMLKQAESEASILTEHHSKETVIKTKEQNQEKLESDLAYYFNKAGKDIDTIDSQRAMDLSQDILQYHKEKDELQDAFTEIRNSRKQMDFLSDEVKGIEQEIISLLEQAGAEVSEEIEQIAEQIEELIKFQTDKQEVNDELAKVEYDLSSYSAIISSVEEMEERRQQVDEEIDKMIEKNPALADLPDPNPDDPPPATMPWAERADREEARDKREALIVKLRTACNSRDEKHLDTREELAAVAHELICARRAKLALELARDVLSNTSSATYANWSNELNEAAEKLVGELDSDIEWIRFDDDLDLSIKLKEVDTPFNSFDIKKKMSTGIREQVHWFARMALSRFLSGADALPIILDEPFSEADDERFADIMRFLVESVAPHHQLIILSCHKHRHEWLVSELGSDRLSFRKRETLSDIDSDVSVAISS